MAANTAGDYKTAIGSISFRKPYKIFFMHCCWNIILYYQNTTGTQIRTAVGTYALDANTTGQHNTGLGSHALGLNDSWW